MKGKHRVIVQNNRLHYEFEIKRNITILKGDSATGKTNLINMLRAAENLGPDSGVSVESDVSCRVLEGVNWKLVLKGVKNTVFFVDEENSFITTQDFAAEVSGADNYFVIITRENLYNLPYSVDEIYGLHSSGRYQNTRQIYQQFYRIYSDTAELSVPIKPKRIITEDSNAGYEFFSELSRDKGIECISANGKSNISKLLRDEFQGLNHPTQNDKETCIIADGAAIGPEMNTLYELTKRIKGVKLYLPESFEWLILKSGLIDGKEVENILESPEDYIDSRNYVS